MRQPAGQPGSPCSPYSAGSTAPHAPIDVEGFRSEGPWRFFNTDGEANVPTVYSGLLLFAGAFLAARVARSGRAGNSRTWWFVAGVLAFMGLDEGMTIHEHVATGSA